MRTFRCGTTTVRHVSARNSSTAAAKETGTDSRRSGRVVGFAKLGELRPEMQQRICERPQEMSNLAMLVVVMARTIIMQLLH